MQLHLPVAQVKQAQFLVTKDAIYLTLKSFTESSMLALEIFRPV